MADSKELQTELAMIFRLLPSLESVHLRVRDGIMRIGAVSPTGVMLESKLDWPGPEFVAQIDGKALLAMTRAAKQIEIELADDKLNIKAGRSKASLAVQTENRPSFPKKSELEDSKTISSKNLAILRKILPAANLSKISDTGRLGIVANDSGWTIVNYDDSLAAYVTHKGKGDLHLVFASDTISLVKTALDLFSGEVTVASFNNALYMGDEFRRLILTPLNMDLDNFDELLQGDKIIFQIASAKFSEALETIAVLSTKSNDDPDVVTLTTFDRGLNLTLANKNGRMTTLIPGHSPRKVSFSVLLDSLRDVAKLISEEVTISVTMDEEKAVNSARLRCATGTYLVVTSV